MDRITSVRPLLAVALVLVLISATSPCARTWHIKPDGTGDVPTIQDAFDLGSGGDVIELADGTYRGDGNRDVDFLGKEIVVRSVSDDPLACVIDVQGAPGDIHRGFILQNQEGPNAGLRSLTITGGCMTGQESQGKGGAVYCCYRTQPFFENVRFEANTALTGGAVYARWEGNVRFEDCDFLGCQAIRMDGGGFGGAVYLAGAQGTFTRCRFIRNEAWYADGALLATGTLLPLTLTDCDFEENVSRTDGAGAVLASESAVIMDCRFVRNEVQGTHARGGALAAHELDMAGCTFIENTAGLGGGAVVVWNASNEPVSVRACAFLANEASRGGALYLDGAGPASICDCHFEANRATGNVFSTDGGGSIYLSFDASGQVRGSSFIDNSAAYYGGAVCSRGIGLTMESCTLVRNAAPEGGGIFFFPPIRARENAAKLAFLVEQTVIAFGTQGRALFCWSETDPTIACSNFFGNAGGNTFCGTDGGGNFSADPLFCDPSSGDFTLAADSPCLPGNHPTGWDCGLIGALGEGCGPVSLTPQTWARVKARYR
jgi:predicted outer membrane repeat protein